MQNTDRITHAIFDMDGLMFDNEKLYAICFEKAIGPAYNLQVTQKDYLPFMGLNGTDTANLFHTKYGIPLSEWEHISNLETQWLDKYIEENGIIIKPGLIELLKWLQKHHIDYTIASGSPRRNIIRNLRKSSLESFFDLSRAVDGSMIISGKPSPDIFNKAASLIGCSKPECCVVFEDSFNGVSAANNGGFPCIWVPDPEDPSRTSDLKYLAKLNSLDEAIKVLEPLV